MYERPYVTATGVFFLLEHKANVIVVLQNVSSLAAQPHWSVVAQRLQEATQLTCPPVTEASPDLQQDNLAIEKEAGRGGSEEGGAGGPCRRAHGLGASCGWSAGKNRLVWVINGSARLGPARRAGAGERLAQGRMCNLNAQYCKVFQ